MVTDAALGACLVLGASSQLGDCVVPRLLAAQYRVHAVSRQRYEAPIYTRPTDKTEPKQQAESEPELNQLQWHHFDLNSVHTWPIAVTVVVHLAPLYLLPALLRHAPTPVRVIAISSTSARTKQHSPALAERQMAQRLCQAEQELQQLCAAQGHSLTILRPTMLYGLGRDATIGRMQAFVRRWHFLPIPATATGLRQPVHVEDIAAAVLQVLDQPRSRAQIYELGGAQRLTVQQMARCICEDNRLPVRIVSIPAAVLYTLLKILAWLRPSLDWSPALLQRAAVDQIADNQPAIDDFGYAPRRFDGAFYRPAAGSVRRS